MGGQRRKDREAEYPMEEGARRLVREDRPEAASSIPPPREDAAELREVGPSDSGEHGPEDPGAQGAEPTLHQFHEWSIKRLEHRLRKLTWATGAIAALVVVILGALVFDRTTREPADPLATAAAAEAALGPLRDDVSSIAADVDALARQLEARIDRLEAAVDETPVGTREIGEALSAMRRELNELKRCTSTAVRELDEGLRGLLAREIDANEWVDRPPMEDCR